MFDRTTQIGRIYNAAYIPSNWTNIISYNGTCFQCICYAFFSNTSLNYQGLNCYANNQSCLLFTNSLSKSMIRININSTFILSQNLTEDSDITTVTPSITTSTSQCYSPQWNSTGIIFAGDGSNLNQIYNVFCLFIVAGSDILYIADSGNERILKWLPGNTSGTLIAGGQGAGSNATQLSNPTEVCVDRNGNLFVADSANYRIQYFPNGSSIGRTFVNNATYNTVNASVGNMFGIGVDLQGNVYASEYNKARVMKWSPNGTNGTQVAGNGTQGIAANQLNVPTAFYIDPITAILYIPNQGSHCVTKWVPGSSTGTTVAGVCGIAGSNETLLNSPKCVTFDKYGNMYVLDYVNNGRVSVFCPNSLIGKPIITSGLNNPVSLAVDTQLNIYVADYVSTTILKYTLL